jgi:GNAT superfamily N-acetyltransferase
MPDLLRRIELAAVRGWPALESAEVDGWIWRHTSGGSIRANSVAALDYIGADLAASIGEVEARYGARGAPACFTISEVSRPDGLGLELERRGYRRSDDHVTMAKPVSARLPAMGRVTIAAAPTDDWMRIYLCGLSADRRGIAPRLIAGLPPGARFITAHVAGAAISSGLTIVDGSLASVQCMATLTEARRMGGAAAVLAAIECCAGDGGASHLYLQTGGDNVAALAHYRHSGFAVAGRYHTRTRPILAESVSDHVAPGTG